MKALFLSFPWFYNLVQLIIATPAVKKMKGYLDDNDITTNPNLTVLDVGCGPGEYSKWFSGKYTGIDISEQYINNAGKKYLNANFVECDATNFDLHKTFDVCVSIGLYHHLPDEAVLRSIKATLNHLGTQSKFYVFDAILPKSLLGNPVGYILRKMDRGKFVRTYNTYKKLLDSTGVTVNYCRSERGGFLDYIVYVIEKR